MGNPFTVNELKYTSGCRTFPNASLLVRTFDYSIVVMVLLPRDSTSFSQSRYQSDIPRETRRSYALSLRSVVDPGTIMSPATLTSAIFGFINRFFFFVRT